MNQKALHESKAYLNTVYILCFVCSIFGGAISTLMSVFLPTVIQELRSEIPNSNLDQIGGIINAVFIYGWALGGFSLGYICDKIGRKKALIGTIFCYSFFTILTGQMHDWVGIMICRFLSGFGVGGEMVIATTLISEIWPPKTKAIMIGILSIAFPIGIFSAGTINLITNQWRDGFLIGLIPFFLAISSLFFLKESPAWIYRKLNPIVKQHVFSGENRLALLYGSLLFGSMLIGLWSTFSWLPSWIQTICVGNASKPRGLSMMFMGMGGLIGGFSSGWIVNRFGLKKSMALCFSVSILLSFVLFKTNSSISLLVYVEIAIMALFFGISQGVLAMFIPHLFSTEVRATATGFCFNIGRIFTATAILFIGILVSGLGGIGNAIFLFSFVFVIGLLAVIGAPKNLI